MAPGDSPGSRFTIASAPGLKGEILELIPVLG
jgi:hypothetical protein